MLLTRRSALLSLLAGGCAPRPRPSPGTPSPLAAPPDPPPVQPVATFPLAESSIADLRGGMASGDWTARELTVLYLERIAKLDGELGAVIELVSDAVEQAEALDRERRTVGVRGPLHGIPILLKDNIATADGTQTTAGSLALMNHRPPRDSFVAARLRAAGALLLGKTNLSEWANFRSKQAVSGWSSRGGQCHNPYEPTRNPCGSSSGSAVATSASFCAAALGTETHGSIICPSSACGIVGLKPTVGLVSRRGVIPIAHSFDTAGPMTRSVRDAAELLAAMQGVDPEDEATAAARPHASRVYTDALKEDAMKGARIGVARRSFGFHSGTDDIVEEALGAMRMAGAELVDPIDVAFPRALFDDILEVMFFEMKAGLNAYLAELPSDDGPMTLADVIAFNEAHAERVMPHFDQELLIEAQRRGTLEDAHYRSALAAIRRAAREEGIDRAVAEHRLDAIVAPSGSPAWLTDHVLGDHFVGGSATLAAMAGYPNITVPAGQVRGLPVGLSLFGPAWSEPKLLGLAHVFEQATHHRRPPPLDAMPMERDR